MKFSFSLMVLLSLGLVNSASVKAESEGCKSVLLEKMNVLLRATVPPVSDAKIQANATQNSPSSAHVLAHKYKVLMSKIERSPAQLPSVK